jgi:hypothetical protein
MFSHVYSDPHPQIERQEREFLEYLAGFADEAVAHDAAPAQAATAGVAR